MMSHCEVPEPTDLDLAEAGSGGYICHKLPCSAARSLLAHTAISRGLWEPLLVGRVP